MENHLSSTGHTIYLSSQKAADTNVTNTRLSESQLQELTSFGLPGFCSLALLHPCFNANSELGQTQMVANVRLLVK